MLLDITLSDASDAASSVNLVFSLAAQSFTAKRTKHKGLSGLVMATTIGEQLRHAREERGIPLREISAQTRISVHYLEAIESDDYKRLPGGIFNRSFVKAYARCVGYDEKEAVEGYTRYMREQGESGDDVATTPYHSKVYTDTPATRSPFLTVVLAILILAILTLAALAALHWYQRRSAEVSSQKQSLRLVTIKTPVGSALGFHSVAAGRGFWKADYKQVWQ